MSSPPQGSTGDAGREVAPPFTLTGASGVTFSLDAQRDARRTLLIFYPQDMTSG